jgi:hypothetical protein
LYYFFILPIFLLAMSIYKRYVPVKDVPCIENEHVIKNGNTAILDLRDYNESDLHLNAIHIPYAYLPRFYKEIPHIKVHVIAANRLELNLGLRFLKRKGFNVTSFELKDCPCKKGILDYGI